MLRRLWGSQLARAPKGVSHLSQNQEARGQPVGRGVFLALALVASVATLLATAAGVSAQTEVPEAPTNVAVYTYKSEQLEVRWSTSDAAATTSFKIQWKSGSEEFASSRQLTSDPATSIESDQSTAAGDRYVGIITGLTDGTEYTVRVIATNANGDSEPSGEVTGTPQSLPGQVREFVENEVVELFEDSFPWLRETWDYIIDESIPVEFFAGTGGSIYRSCDRVEMNLKKCRAENRWGGVRLGRDYPRPVHLIAHELAHVYTLANGVAAEPGPLGIASLYFYDLLPPTSFLLTPFELLKPSARPMSSTPMRWPSWFMGTGIRSSTGRAVTLSPMTWRWRHWPLSGAQPRERCHPGWLKRSRTSTEILTWTMSGPAWRQCRTQRTR